MVLLVFFFVHMELITVFPVAHMFVIYREEKKITCSAAAATAVVKREKKLVITIQCEAKLEFKAKEKKNSVSVVV